MDLIAEPDESTFRLGQGLSGDIYIKAGDFIVATFHYDYRYTCNATLHLHAETCLRALQGLSRPPCPEEEHPNAS